MSRSLLRSLLRSASVLAALTAVAGSAHAGSGAVSGGGSRLPLEVLCEFPASGGDYDAFMVVAAPLTIDARGGNAAYFRGTADGVRFDDRMSPWRRITRQPDGSSIVEYAQDGERGPTIRIDQGQRGEPRAVAALRYLPTVLEDARCFWKATASYPERGVERVEGLCAFEAWDVCRESR